MRRVALSTLLPVLATLLIAASAHAQLYPAYNRVGIYFDTGANTNWLTATPNFPQTAYLILTNASGIGYGIRSFECRVNLPANAWYYAIELPPQAVNAYTFPNLAVNLATPLPRATAITLATITFLGLTTSRGDWTVTPLLGGTQTIPGAMSYRTADTLEDHVNYLQASHVPAAVINPDLSFVVDVEPDESRGAWRLTGPSGYVCESSGDSTFSGLPFGSYTITWLGAGVWAPMTSASTTRTHDQWSGACVFSGSFQQRAQAVIAIRPPGLAALWLLKGPDGFWRLGAGDQAVPGIAPGTYTVDWSPVANWQMPEPSSTTLSVQLGQTITFEGVYHAPAAIPGAEAALRLLPARPNPFNPRTSIAFELPAAAQVRLDIFDLAGRRITTLLSASLPAGPHAATWDGTDARGGAAPSGNYVARLTAGTQARSIGLQLLR